MPLSAADLADRIDCLLFDVDSPVSPWHLSSGAAAPLTITYQFETAPPVDRPAGFYSGWTPFTGAQKQAVRAALNQYAEVINVNFVETVGNADPDINFGRVNLGTGGYGAFNYHYTLGAGGIVTSRQWDAYAVFDDARVLTDDMNLILHETGHALFLKHPGNYDVGGDLPEGPFLPATEDNNRYSVMSYNAHPGTGEFPGELMLYDIAALQAMWGADYSTRSGATVYLGPGSVPAFALADGESRMICIWDGGGQDRLSAANQTSSVTIDLRPGAFSTIGPVANTIAIAYGCAIENADGGSAGDRLTGNGQANVLNGGAGADMLNGLGGNDTLNGGAGNDVMAGGPGNDIYVRNASGDTVTEAADEGTDTVQSSVTATLGANQENLTLTGSAALNGTGNAGNNVLTGNTGNNALSGGASGDTLTGNAGNDTLNGGDGNDVLRGQIGADVLTGGLGTDRFDYDAVTESGLALTNRDTITDFQRAQADRIDLSGIDANTAVAGNQAFTFIVSPAFNAPGQLRFDNATDILNGNTDADGTAEFSIKVTGLSSMTAGDFIL